LSLVVCLAWSPVALATTASDDQAQALAATAANHGLKPPEPPAVISRDEEGRTIVRALRLTERLRMDGTLDESVYQTVPPITGLFQQVPDQGAPLRRGAGTRPRPTSGWPTTTGATRPR